MLPKRRKPYYTYNRFIEDLEKIAGKKIASIDPATEEGKRELTEVVTKSEYFKQKPRGPHILKMYGHCKGVELPPCPPAVCVLETDQDLVARLKALTLRIEALEKGAGEKDNGKKTESKSKEP